MADSDVKTGPENDRGATGDPGTGPADSDLRRAMMAWAELFGRPDRELGQLGEAHVTLRFIVEYRNGQHYAEVHALNPVEGETLHATESIDPQHQKYLTASVFDGALHGVWLRCVEKGWL